MKKAPQLQILKGGGHTMGTWKGAPVKGPAKKEDTDPQVNEDPMLPILLEDVEADVTKAVTTDVTKDGQEEALLPPQL